MRKRLAALVGTLIMAASLLVGTHGASADQPVCGGSYDQLPIRWQAWQVTIWQISNRCYHGGSALVVDLDLAATAQRQADQMARSGTIWHQDLRPTLNRGWRWLGEAVASGPDMWSAHAAICWSPAHLALQLNPRAEAIGAGVAMRPDGSTYVSVVFGDA